MRNGYFLFRLSGSISLRDTHDHPQETDRERKSKKMASTVQNLGEPKPEQDKVYDPKMLTAMLKTLSDEETTAMLILEMWQRSKFGFSFDFTGHIAWSNNELSLSRKLIAETETKLNQLKSTLAEAPSKIHLNHEEGKKLTKFQHITDKVYRDLFATAAEVAAHNKAKKDRDELPAAIEALETKLSNDRQVYDTMVEKLAKKILDKIDDLTKAAKAKAPGL